MTDHPIIVRPVRAIKRRLREVGGTYMRVHNQLGLMGFAVSHRCHTNIDSLLSGLPKPVLNDLAHALSA
jgi:hypothetical protein